MSISPNKKKVLVLFGTRPEVIKLAPVITELKAQPKSFEVVTVSTGQHTDLLVPFLQIFGIEPDFSLQVMTAAQTPSDVCARVMTALDKILLAEKPDVVLVQGDTSSALAGAMAAFHRQIAVGHVEAGLRSGNPLSPFPEEMNRRLISKIANFHFAATEDNGETLMLEGVSGDDIFVTGNPVVDRSLSATKQPLPSVRASANSQPKVEQSSAAPRRAAAGGDTDWKQF